MLYRFHVVTVNAIGLSEASPVISINAAEIPDAPAKPTLISQAANAITIAWVDLPVS